VGGKFGVKEVKLLSDTSSVINPDGRTGLKEVRLLLLADTFTTVGGMEIVSAFPSSRFANEKL
jgi:hypothetical protein